MRKIGNLIEDSDKSLVTIMNKVGHIVARGHWYEDNILKYTNVDGDVAPGYTMYVTL